MRRVTSEKAGVIDAWAAAGKIVPVDARHLFILLYLRRNFMSSLKLSPVMHSMSVSWEKMIMRKPPRQ